MQRRSRALGRVITLGLRYGVVHGQLLCSFTFRDGRKRFTVAPNKSVSCIQTETRRTHPNDIAETERQVSRAFRRPARLRFAKMMSAATTVVTLAFAMPHQLCRGMVGRTATNRCTFSRHGRAPSIAKLQEERAPQRKTHVNRALRCPPACSASLVLAAPPPRPPLVLLGTACFGLRANAHSPNTQTDTHTQNVHSGVCVMLPD